MSWIALAAQCAPSVSPVTIERIIAVESRGDPLALHVNHLRVQPPRAATPADATATALRFIAAGYSVDLGLLQVNSANLAAFGSTVAEQFDISSCSNIRTGAAILSAAYEKSLQLASPGQPALRVALSIYNTGNATRGFTNGYVSRYYGVIPSLPILGSLATSARRRTVAANPYSADATVQLAQDRDDAH